MRLYIIRKDFFVNCHSRMVTRLNHAGTSLLGNPPRHFWTFGQRPFIRHSGLQIPNERRGWKVIVTEISPACFRTVSVTQVHRCGDPFVNLRNNQFVIPNGLERIVAFQLRAMTERSETR